MRGQRETTCSVGAQVPFGRLTDSSSDGRIQLKTRHALIVTRRHRRAQCTVYGRTVYRFNHMRISHNPTTNRPIDRCHTLIGPVTSRVHNIDTRRCWLTAIQLTDGIPTTHNVAGQGIFYHTITPPALLLAPSALW